MVEAHFAEIEKTLLYVSGRRASAAKTAKELRKAAAPRHLIDAVEETERSLAKLGDRLTQETYFAIPSDQLEIDTPVDELTVS
jgi:hypothetical protein